jgi:hypothetical protein
LRQTTITYYMYVCIYIYTHTYIYIYIYIRCLLPDANSEKKKRHLVLGTVVVSSS